jgi:hypothetical protein
MNENERAKQSFIDAFFHELEQKFAFVEELASSGHRDEAMMLCCVYLDGVANWVQGPGDGSTARSFSEVLIAHGGEPSLALITLAHLDERLPSKKTPRVFREALRSALAALPQSEALTKAELLASVSGRVSPDAVAWLEREAWRLSLANVAYTHLRCPNVHQLGSSGGISFDATNHHGKPVPGIDLGMLHRALNRILEHARKVSADTNRFFGHV